MANTMRRGVQLVTRRRLVESLLCAAGALCLLVGCDGGGGAYAPQPRPRARGGVPAKASVAALNRLLARVRSNQAVEVPAAARVNNIRPRRQLNAYLCLITCAQMLFDHLGINRGNQYQLGREYARANPTSPGRRILAKLDDRHLRRADWSKIATNLNGLRKYLDTLGDVGKCYFWDYAGTGDAARTFRGLQVLLAHNVPVIVSIKGRAADGAHAVLLVGYGPRDVTVIDPIPGKRVTLTRKRFTTMFKRVNCEWVTFVKE